MKFTKDTIKILKSFATINQSIVIKPGSVIATMSPQKTIIAKAQIDQEFDTQFAIYDLSRFLSTLSLFNDPEVEITEKKAEIANGKKKVAYVFTDAENVITPPEKAIKFPEVDVQFTLLPEVLSEVLKAASVLSLPEIAVAGDGSKIYITAIDSKTPTGDKLSVEVGDTSDHFNMIFKIENIKIIPDTYEVSISAKGLSRFTSEKLEYFITTEATSTFTKA